MPEGKILEQIDPRERHYEIVMDLDRLADLASRGQYEEITPKNFPAVNIIDLRCHYLVAVQTQRKHWQSVKDEVIANQNVSGQPFNGGVMTPVEGINTLIGFFDELEMDALEDLNEMMRATLEAVKEME